MHICTLRNAFFFFIMTFLASIVKAFTFVMCGCFVFHLLLS